MKILNKYILKELATPFFGSLIVIIMVLLSNFLLKNLDKFLGKGISLSVVLKFILLNSAWIFSLAVPMAILITTLMAYGRLSSSNEITAFKASGITFFDFLSKSRKSIWLLSIPTGEKGSRSTHLISRYSIPSDLKIFIGLSPEGQTLLGLMVL